MSGLHAPSFDDFEAALTDFKSLPRFQGKPACFSSSSHPGTSGGEDPESTWRAWQLKNKPHANNMIVVCDMCLIA